MAEFSITEKYFPLEMQFDTICAPTNFLFILNELGVYNQRRGVFFAVFHSLFNFRE
jgi:hypothetical protein